MKIAAVLCLKSDNGIDEYYIPIAIKSLLPYVQGFYIQDQGCTDRTIEIVKETIDGKVPYVIGLEPTRLPRFDIGYNETLFRNKAIEGCERHFDSEWIVQNDADDFFTEYFFETVKALEADGNLAGCNSVFYATERFITPEYRSGWRGDLIEFGGKFWHDPHCKFWRKDFKLRYPDREPGQFHNPAARDPHPALVLDGICNIHLHRTFGPKAFNFWRQDGDVFEETKPFNPRRQAPKWFSSPQNMGSWVKTDYQWPEYVMAKWREWGTYD